jgi:hypothetical protein
MDNVGLGHALDRAGDLQEARLKPFALLAAGQVIDARPLIYAHKPTKIE